MANQLARRGIGLPLPTRTKPLARRTPEAGVVGEPQRAMTLVSRDCPPEGSAEGQDVEFLASWRLGERLGISEERHDRK